MARRKKQTDQKHKQYQRQEITLVPCFYDGYMLYRAVPYYIWDCHACMYEQTVYNVAQEPITKENNPELYAIITERAANIVARPTTVESLRIQTRQRMRHPQQAILPSEQVTHPSEQVTRPSEQVTRPSEQVTRPSEQVTRPSEQECDSMAKKVLAELQLLDA